MKLSITHSTVYAYEEVVPYALQQVRLTPKTRQGQTVLDWETNIKGGKIELCFDDHHNNHVALVSLEDGSQQIEIAVNGTVETTNTSGVIGKHGGYAPLWYFRRSTKLTKPGQLINKLVKSLDQSLTDDIERLHFLSVAIANEIAYQTGHTNSDTTAEEALKQGCGVCQDHSHVFLSAARLLGFPARYVSGYLMMNDRINQDASHAWVEVHIEGLGWVGFDVSNAISPDERYVPVATGLDYSESAPVSGMRFGSGNESMIVSLQVQQ